MPWPSVVVGETWAETVGEGDADAVRVGSGVSTPGVAVDVGWGLGVFSAGVSSAEELGLGEGDANEVGVEVAAELGVEVAGEVPGGVGSPLQAIDEVARRAQISLSRAVPVWGCRAI